MAFKKYSDNPEDWFRICGGCKEKFMFKKYSAFATHCKFIADGGTTRCNSCAQTGKKMSDEFREKCSQKVISEETRSKHRENTKKRYENMTEEEYQSYIEKQTEGIRKSWERLTPEERKERHKKSEEGLRNLSPERKSEKNKKISEANKKPDGLSNNPETWKLPCSGCETEITFEKYHRFQNAKSEIKKGKEKFCDECKLKRNKRSKVHRSEWVIECNDEDCSNIIQYENLPAFGQALKRIEEGTPKYCDNCRETKYPKKNGASKMYSNNPEDWNVKCKFDECEKILTYNSYDAWCTISKRIKDKNPPMCYSCAAKNWERTEEYKEKLRGRTHTEETKQLLRSRFEKMTDEEFQSYCFQQSVHSTNTWNNLSLEERSVRIERLRKLNDRSVEERTRINKILSDKAYERISQYGSRIGFQPAYNIDTIEYIETVLNNTFETTFIHAENGGEFKLFDEELKIHYFADAYCPRLNIWIEFDERHKFKNGKLLNEHIIRHDRICEILNCKMIRFRIDKHYKTRNILNISEFQINKGE